MINDLSTRLKILADKIAEAVILDADPDFWTSSGIRANALTKDERGDAYWCRKLASSSLGVMTKVMVLIAIVERRENAKVTDEEIADDGQDLKKRIKAAEREAAEILKRARARSDECKH